MFWLMIFTAAWVHVFGNYASKDECEKAASAMVRGTFEPTLPRHACVPAPAPTPPAK